MKLKNNEQVLAFETKDYLGHRISTADFADSKILLSFYRYASCPLCNLRVNQLIQKYPEYNSKGLKIFSFFESSAESIQKYVGKQNPPFALIPDPDRKFYKMYGVETHFFKFVIGLLNSKIWKAMGKGFLPGKMEGAVSMIPADFLIQNGKIIHAYYGKDSSDHIPISTIEDFLR